MRFANHDGRLTLIAAGPDDELDGASGIDGIGAMSHTFVGAPAVQEAQRFWN